MSATLTTPTPCHPADWRQWRKQMKQARRAAFWGDHPLGFWRVPLTVLGFIAWWPIGLALLALFAFWRPVMACTPWTDRLRDALPRAGSGNAAFDEHRDAVLARLEEERRQLYAQQEEFAAFMRQLRRAKDQEEFDRFMAERNIPAQP